MREACICASKSIARIEGGTNSNLRMMLASDSGSARSTARRSRPAGGGFFVLALLLGLAARAVMNARRSRIWTIPSGSSRVSLYTTRRECAALSNRLINSPSGMSRLTATISARWIITSVMRCSCRPGVLRSMVRSIAEKPTSSGVEASSTTCRSSRTDPGFQPNRVRMARTSQFSAAGRSTSPSCTTAGRLRGLRGLSWVGPESVISVHPLAIRIRIGNAELREDFRFQIFHDFGVSVALVIVADQVQEAVDGEMAEMMIEWLLLIICLAARRFIGDRNVAQHGGRIVGSIVDGRRQGRKRQHVGRLVDTAPVQVERADADIVGQHDREVGLGKTFIGEVPLDEPGRGSDGAVDDGLGVALRLPAIGDNENL